MVSIDKEGASYENGSEWSRVEFSRMQRRATAFVDAGAEPHEAGYLAWRMLARDRPDSGDDRRVCFECAHLRGTRCMKGVGPMLFILQRCGEFEMKDAGRAGKTRTEDSKG